METVAGSFTPQLAGTVTHMFRLDEDLSAFYELVADDDLAWCGLGAGRMLRAPTVFEDVVKTK
jgi:3-methyladenine DNA glycosylase/8-oxoguanine DNA glycosylase